MRKQLKVSLKSSGKHSFDYESAYIKFTYIQILLNFSDVNFIGPLCPRLLIIGDSFVARIDTSAIKKFLPPHWEVYTYGKAWWQN